MAPIVVALKYFIIFLLGFFAGRIAMAVQYAAMKSGATAISQDIGLDKKDGAV